MTLLAIAFAAVVALGAFLLIGLLRTMSGEFPDRHRAGERRDRSWLVLAVCFVGIGVALWMAGPT